MEVQPSTPSTSEGTLIRRVREATIPKLTIRAAAARIGLSPEQWGYIERGYYPGTRGGGILHAPAATVAKMAHSLGISPERLDAEGERPDAAKMVEFIRETRRDEQEHGPVPGVAPEPVRLAHAVAAALEEAAIAEWETEPGAGKAFELHVSQIAPIVERVLREGGLS